MKGVVVDSCCLINLCASRSLHAIVAASMEQGVVPESVLDECLYVRQESEDDKDRLVPMAVDLHPLADSCVLLLAKLTGEAEMDLFVRLAALVDDGEAACLAIAARRGLPLATDDKRAIQVSSSLNVPTLTTPELVKTWADRAAPTPEQVSDVILNIERYGRFRPDSSGLCAQWWGERRLARS